MRRRIQLIGAAVGIVCFLASACLLPIIDAAEDAGVTGDVAVAINAIRAVRAEGAGNEAAAQAWQVLARQDVDQLTTVLAGMDDAGPLATNWFRMAADAIAERQLKQHGRLPLGVLEKFVFDRTHAPRARRSAFEWMVRVDPTAQARLMPRFLDDTSLELRRDAVQQVLDAAQEAEGAAAAELYLKAFHAARDLDQIKICIAEIEQQGRKIEVATHLGFLVDWQVIGPFDNTGQQGFDVAYPPEDRVDLAASYDGKLGKVEWSGHHTPDDYGIVDLAEIYDKCKGAAAYAFTEFVVQERRQVMLRLGCINANKLWVNGKPLMTSEVYHAGMEVDQYVAVAQFKQGKNTLLLKICQNEQEQPWAQRWQFQLRVTDDLGGAILSTDRRIENQAKLDRPDRPKTH